MTTCTITVPRSLNLKNTLKWVNQLHGSPESDHYSFDFKAMDWIEPFPLLFLSANIRQFMSSRPEARFTATNFQDHSYAAHMGFFEAFNLHFGLRPGEAKGSETYLPIKQVLVDELNREAFNNNAHVGDVIETDAKRLAQLLTREEKSHLVETLTYSLREIMRNAVEHSESRKFEYCGQYWKTRNTVEVSVLDCGIGVRRSLTQNPGIKILSDDHCLRFALLPGVSGKTSAEGEIEDYDPWVNTGYGLYLTSKLSALGGSFFICSGSRGLLREKDGPDKYLDSTLRGTALRLVFDTASVLDLKTSLRRLRKEGEELAKRLGTLSKASGASGGIGRK